MKPYERSVKLRIPFDASKTTWLYLKHHAEHSAICVNQYNETVLVVRKASKKLPDVELTQHASASKRYRLMPAGLLSRLPKFL